jgi:thiamine transporter ThiT
MQQKTLERLIGIALILIGISFILNFIQIWDAFTIRQFNLDLVEYLRISISFAGGIASLIAGVALWHDSRHAQ